jgi:hypothetical protein
MEEARAAPRIGAARAFEDLIEAAFDERRLMALVAPYQQS